MDKENKLILYKDDEGKVSVNTRFTDEDVCLTRENLAGIYATTPQNISLHVGNIYQDGELVEDATRKKFFLVRQEGKSKVQREIDHYNLDVKRLKNMNDDEETDFFFAKSNFCITFAI